MRRAPVSHNDVLYVAQRMREADRLEVYATRWSDDPEDLVADVLRAGPFSWVCGLERPIMAIGAVPLCPGVWSVWMFATDDFRQIRLSATRFAKKVMMPALISAGAHRFECRSIDGHVEAQAWLEGLGGRREATHPMAGKDGETFHTYAWTRPDVHLQPAAG